MKVGDIVKYKDAGTPEVTGEVKQVTSVYSQEVGPSLCDVAQIGLDP